MGSNFCKVEKTDADIVNQQIEAVLQKEKKKKESI